MGEDGQHASSASSAALASIALDPPARRCVAPTIARVGHARQADLGRVAGGTGDLAGPSTHGSTGVPIAAGHDVPARSAAVAAGARTIARSGELDLEGVVLARRRRRRARRRRPRRNDCLARRGRRGAPPPRGAPARAWCRPAEGQPHVRDHAVVHRERRGDRDQRELVGLPVAELEVDRAAARSAHRGTSIADDQLARRRSDARPPACRRGAGRSRRSGCGVRRRARRSGRRHRMPTSATATSDGCVAMQCSLVPRIACPRFKPVERRAAAYPARACCTARRRRGGTAQRVRWRRLPPIEAMFRSCSDAPSSNAREMAGISLDDARGAGHVAHPGERADVQSAVGAAPRRRSAAGR